MTDRSTQDQPMKPEDRRDGLVELYREATAGDAGPSAQARERVMAHARKKVAKPPAATTQREAANDWRWLRHALGSVAVIGLVGWLSFQHLERESEQAYRDSEAVPSAPAPATVTPEAADEAAGARSGAPSPQADAMREEALPAPPAPSAMQSPAVAAAPQAERNSTTSEQEARKPAAAAAAPSNMMRKRAESVQKSAELPLCGADMDAAALAEQTRRIEARDKAQAAGRAPSEPAPVCRPAPASPDAAASRQER